MPSKYKVVINRDFPRERYLNMMDSAGHGGRVYHSRLHPDFGAPVARERNGATSLTVMTEANSIFALRHGAARLLAVQIGTSFEPGIVKMNQMEVHERGYRLTANRVQRILRASSIRGSAGNGTVIDKPMVFAAASAEGNHSYAISPCRGAIDGNRAWLAAADQLFGA